MPQKFIKSVSKHLEIQKSYVLVSNHLVTRFEGPYPVKMLCLTIVNRKKNAALSARLMIWLVSNIFGGFPSDLGSTRTKPITPQKNATQGDFWFHRAGHRAAWPRARVCLVHERLTFGQCSWETPNTSQKKKNVFPISVLWSHRLKF